MCIRDSAGAAIVYQPMKATAILPTGATAITTAVRIWSNLATATSDLLVERTAATSYACDNANTNKLISTMEGMSFDTPKGKMTFRKEDHQAMQSMYHFKIKVDPAFAWGVPELVREIKPEEMNVPIRNKR